MEKELKVLKFVNYFTVGDNIYVLMSDENADSEKVPVYPFRLEKITDEQEWAHVNERISEMIAAAIEGIRPESFS